MSLQDVVDQLMDSIIQPDVEFSFNSWIEYLVLETVVKQTKPQLEIIYEKLTLIAQSHVIPAKEAHQVFWLMYVNEPNLERWKWKDNA